MVHHWVQQAQGQRLDRVDWHDRSHAPRAPHRTEAGIEELVLTVRAELEQLSDLGFQALPFLSARWVEKGLQATGHLTDLLD